MSKNIVILADGTGQDGGKGHDSNVYKLYRMLVDRTEDQIVYYEQGVGTDQRKVSGNAFGVGFTENIIQCYRFIFENYNAGDKIFLLGFSRGAATVRSLSSFIHYFGVLPKSRSTLIRDAFELYENGFQPITQDKETFLEEDTRKFIEKLTDRGNQIINDTSYQIYKALRKDLTDKSNQFTTAHPTMWVEVEFLGVWDTVPALGVVPLAGLSLAVDRLPWWRFSFHDFALHRSVKNAYQALSIDDDREWFWPTIWNRYGDESKQKITQVWFSGSHTDVGGGFAEAGLSDITLIWMVEKALAHGLKLYLGSRKYWNFCIAPDATDKLHPPREGVGKVYKMGLRDKVWDEKAVETFGPPVIHESVLERARHDPAYRPWILKNYGNYPDPETWLQENLEKYLRSKFDAEVNDRYEEWCVAQWQSGKQDLIDITEWLIDHPYSYQEWLNQNPEQKEKWQEKNTAFIEEFEGRKFLVERDEAIALRDYDIELCDYDKNTINEKLEQAYVDQRANYNLWQRAMNNGRIEYDRDRWSKLKKTIKKETSPSKAGFDKM
ncbi:MAG: DUF2235 domain-containing protein [Anaerolineales bacterium]|nr:DUF2235 domain-containing protein [Anaerolineales bacterium]